MSNLDPSAILVAPTGSLYIAPEGTTPPTDLTTAWAAAWVELGYLTDDAIVMGSDTNATDIMAWQSDYPVWSNVIVGKTLNFKLMQWDQAVLEFVFGGGTYNALTGVFTYEAPPAAAYDTQSVGIEVIDGPDVTRLVFRRVKISDMGDTNFKKDDAASFDVTVKVLDASPDGPFLIIGNEGAGGALAASRSTAKKSTAKSAA